jgi:polyhydroxyalkanoate synthase
MKTPDDKNNAPLEQWMSTYQELMDKTQQVLQKWSNTDQSIEEDPTVMLSEHAREKYADFLKAIMTDPQKVMMAQTQCITKMMQINQHYWLAIMGQPNDLNNLVLREDKRFKAKEWNENPLYCALKQMYFVIADFMLELVTDVHGLDKKTNAQILFYTQQIVDALAPTNFVATNPELLQKTIKENGANLLAGFNNLLDDLLKNPGRFFISMTDTAAFTIGQNVATTPGKVIYENDLIQLIQYTPTTEKVGAIPLLVVPPWINKYYILDLRPDNSFVKWCVDQGHTVFIISWVNPTKDYANKRFDDYLLEGPVAALNIIEMITKQKKINALGFCIGGTLLGATAAYLAEKKRSILNSVTFLTTLLDFSIPGDLGVFIDEQQLAELDKQLAKYGFLDGRDMRSIFNLLRANDLIWNYFINNYLEGKSPVAFDLLYWNGDSTNLAAAVHQFYLREMYLNNSLKDPNGISLDETPIDLNKIKIPAYFISAELDHIAPWLGTYKGATLFGGKTRFVLGGSGHIAGIVNPPTRVKYGYRTNEKLPKTAEEWLQSCQQHEGSWWNDWQAWITPFMEEMIPKRDPTKGPLPPIEDAPGKYVKKKLED